MRAQSCLTFCDSMNHSPPGSSVHGIFQARILEWIAMPSSRGFSQLRDQTCVSWTAGRFFTLEPPGKPMASGKCPHQVATGRLICGLSKPARASSSPPLSLQWPSPPPGASHITFSAERNKQERRPESLLNLDSPGKARIRVLPHSEQVLLSLQVSQVVSVVKKKKKKSLCQWRRHRRPGLGRCTGGGNGNPLQ